MFKRVSLCLIITLFSFIFVTANGTAESLFSNSGSCGENAAWELVDGTLTISGTGAIVDCSKESSPWYDIRDNIQYIVIEEGITSIGNYAFYDLDKLTSVVFPSTLEVIGDFAFRHTHVVTPIFPYGLKEIGESAFAACWEIKSVDLPDTVTVIGKNAFASAIHIETIKLSANLEKIGAGAFSSVRFKSIIIPDGITIIEKETFRSCSKLETITLPASIIAIDSEAFSDCKVLKDVYYGGSASSVDTIQISSGNTEITSANWHCSDGSIDALGAKEGECGSGVYWNFSDGVLTISGMGSMNDCTKESSPWYDIRDNIQYIVIEEGITSIGNYAFYDLDKLTSVVFPSTLEVIGDFAFRHTHVVTPVFPYGLKEIGESAFAACWEIKSVDLPDTVTVIGKNAFASAIHIETIKLSANLEKIGAGAFSNVRFKSIIIPSSITTIEKETFRSCGDLESIKLPITVVEICEEAFSGCKNLKEVHYEGTIDDARIISFAKDNSEITSAKWFCDEPYDEATTAVSFMKVKVNNGSNVRSGPSSDYDKIAYADAGEIYDCLGEENGWYKIKLKDGNFGYIATSRCSVVD